MKRALLGFLLALFLCGCERAITVGLAGGASFTRCRGRCELAATVDVDTLLSLEGAREADAIIYAGRVFVCGDGFANIWVGEIRGKEVEFVPHALPGAPAVDFRFDWRAGKLVAQWKGALGKPHEFVFDEDGRIIPPKRKRR